MYPILLTGGALYPFNLSELGVAKLASWLEANEITVVTSVPTVFRLLCEMCGDHILTDIRLVRLSGDRILRSDVLNFRKNFSEKCLLRVSLGAAECLLYTQYFFTKHEEAIPEIVPVGYPLEDVDILIFDDYLQKVEPGTIGEIAVRSKYLSVGYLDNLPLTRERFLTNDGSSERVYLTRDLGFVDENGRLFHVGRKDFNVKVNGKMVSLLAIEEALMKIPRIKEVAVTSNRSVSGENVITAFYLSHDTKQMFSKDLRAQAMHYLPIEQIPTRWVFLDSFPLTQNNKLDRRTLTRLAGDG
jgi:acyl-coenzyme A synthetase/AMP-(fatty) acid ligase